MHRYSSQYALSVPSFRGLIDLLSYSYASRFSILHQIEALHTLRPEAWEDLLCEVLPGKSPLCESFVVSNVRQVEFCRVNVSRVRIFRVRIYRVWLLSGKDSSLQEVLG